MIFPYSGDAPNEGRFPVINWALIAINVWCFIALGLRPDYESIVLNYGFIPAVFNPITLLTCMFLHGGWLHLLGNMWFLYLFGDNVENRLGSFKYLVTYLICGVAGSLCQYAFFTDSEIPTLGASGAIAGVMGMYIFWFPANRIKIFYFFLLFAGATAVRAIWVVGIWFAMELFYSKLESAGGMQSGIAHLAHTGGLVAGMFLAALYTVSGVVRNDHRNLWSYLFGTMASPRRVTNSYGNGTNEGDVSEAHYRLLRNEEFNDPRAKIVELLHAGQVDEARRAWRRYAFDNHESVLPPREQLEIALALDKQGERSAARDAYERLIKNYPNEQPFAAEANLDLAGMLLQELKEKGTPGEVPLIENLLKRAAATHPYEARRALAERWLETLRQYQI